MCFNIKNTRPNTLLKCAFTVRTYSVGHIGLAEVSSGSPFKISSTDDCSGMFCCWGNRTAEVVGLPSETLAYFLTNIILNNLGCRNNITPKDAQSSRRQLSLIMVNKLWTLKFNLFMRIDIYIAVNHLYINLSNDSTLKLLLTENQGSC